MAQLFLRVPAVLTASPDSPPTAGAGRPPQPCVAAWGQHFHCPELGSRAERKPESTLSCYAVLVFTFFLNSSFFSVEFLCLTSFVSGRIGSCDLPRCPQLSIGRVKLQTKPHIQAGKRAIPWRQHLSRNANLKSLALSSRLRENTSYWMSQSVT